MTGVGRIITQSEASTASRFSGVKYRGNTENENSRMTPRTGDVEVERVDQEDCRRNQEADKEARIKSRLLNQVYKGTTLKHWLFFVVSSHISRNVVQCVKTCISKKTPRHLGAPVSTLRDEF